MAHSMLMTAMESLMCVNMVYLDIIAGLGGLVLATLINKGIGNFDFKKLLLRLVPLVLVSRIIVDYIYSKTVSEQEMFGGSNKEFIISSVVWLVLLKLVVPKQSNQHNVVLYLSTVLVMLATARVTHWG